MPSLPVVTAAVRRAIQRTRVTSAIGDDGIGPAFINHAVFGSTAHTPEHVLAPLLGCFPVLSCVKAMYQQRGRLHGLHLYTRRVTGLTQAITA
jgi:hypothetical protein